MRSLLIAMLFACGGSAPPPAAPITSSAPPPTTPAPAATDPNSVAGMRVNMSKFADDMCACKDSACAQTVADAMTKWAQDMSKNNQAPPRLSDQEAKELTELGEHMAKCMQTAMGGGSTPPP